MSFNYSTITNDTFKTKQISLSTLVDNNKGYQTKINPNNKEVLSIDINDSRVVEMILNEFVSFGDYDYNREPDPQTEANNSWNMYGDHTLSEVNNIGLSPVDLFPGAANSILMNDSINSAVAYYYKELTLTQQEQIKMTGIGHCDFDIALLPVRIGREAPYKFSNITFTDLEFFKNTYINQHNFISFGAYDYYQPLLQFRFNLLFRTKLNMTTNKWEVYSFTSLNELEEAGVLIPNWDGLSIRSFKFVYTPNASNVISGTLMMLDGDTWVDIRENVLAAQDQATFVNAPEFGSYSTPGYSCLAINKFLFKAFIRDNYSFKFDGKSFPSYIEFIDYCQDLYSYDIKGSGESTVDWFFGDKQNLVTLSDSSKLLFNRDWFSNTSPTTYEYFNKKYKNIKIYSPVGSITDFNAINKQIYNINTNALSNLKNLNLSSNDIKVLDLSENKLIETINLSNNLNLTTLRLPKGDIETIKNLTLSNTSIINLELINSKLTLYDLTLNLSNMLNLESLTLRRLNILSPELFASYEFPKIKQIDLCESSILKDKTNLESFLNNLPDRSNSEPGIIYLYGEKYLVDGIQGSTKAIAQTLLNLKNKNWLFYL